MRLTIERKCRCGFAAGALLLSIAAPLPTNAAGGFRDITEQAGLTHVQREVPSTDNRAGHTTAGGAVGDFFGNGRNDLFVTRHDNTDIFYMNMGDGTFEDRTTGVFGFDPINAPTNGALLADLTNNGHLDLYVTTVGIDRHYLFINDGQGRLTEQAQERGATGVNGGFLAGTSVTAGDFTGNGYLDLYVSNWSLIEGANRLLRNRGAEAPGYFEDVTASAGIGGTGNRFGFGGRFVDINRNGLLDLIPYNDFKNHQFYFNRGDGTFREASAETGTTLGTFEMGISVADFNNNGWMDIFLTDIEQNTLYINEMHRKVPGLFFSDRTDAAGVRTNYWGWGVATIDYNNNGWRDLVIVNGYLGEESRQFFRNDGSPEVSFTSMAEEVGLDGAARGRGVIAADFTGNGWQDVLILNHAARPILYENLGGDSNWLRINLVGTVSNRRGIGAWITVTPDLNDPQFQYVHEVNLEANFLSHNETTAHFGLGRLGRATVDHVHIRWPSGIEQEFVNVERDRVHTFVERFRSLERDRYDAAVSAAGLTDTKAEPEAAPFGDGVKNLLKYAFNMDFQQADRRVLTMGGDEAAGLPAIVRKGEPPAPVLRIEFIRRRNSDLIYTPFSSTDLVEWKPATTEIGVIGIDTEWERAIVEIPLDPFAPRTFGMVTVTLP